MHRGLHGAGAEPIQGFLAGLIRGRKRRRQRSMGRKAREDDSTKEFKKAAKAMDNQPTKKEEKKIEKTTKRLSKNEKI
jgi:hypothetical protein